MTTCQTSIRTILFLGLLLFAVACESDAVPEGQENEPAVITPRLITAFNLGYYVYPSRNVQ